MWVCVLLWPVFIFVSRSCSHRIRVVPTRTESFPDSRVANCRHGFAVVTAPSPPVTAGALGVFLGSVVVLNPFLFLLVVVYFSRVYSLYFLVIFHILDHRFHCQRCTVYTIESIIFFNRLISLYCTQYTPWHCNRLSTECYFDISSFGCFASCIFQKEYCFAVYLPRVRLSCYHGYIRSGSVDARQSILIDQFEMCQARTTQNGGMFHTGSSRVHHLATVIPKIYWYINMNRSSSITWLQWGKYQTRQVAKRDCMFRAPYWCYVFYLCCGTQTCTPD